jgi:hypothetical protein
VSNVPDYEHGEPAPIPNKGASMHDLVIIDMLERREFGRRKYGTVLQARNGRNPLRDAYEEALDLVVYLRQALEEATDEDRRVSG